MTTSSCLPWGEENAISGDSNGKLSQVSPNKRLSQGEKEKAGDALRRKRKRIPPHKGSGERTPLSQEKKFSPEKKSATEKRRRDRDCLGKGGGALFVIRKKKGARHA